MSGNSAEWYRSDIVRSGIGAIIAEWYRSDIARSGIGAI